MSTTPPPVAAAGRGRAALRLGFVAAIAGAVLYAVQLLVLRWTNTPWYAPVLATLGATLILVSLLSRPTLWRGLAFVLIAAVAGFEWWFLTSYARLPAYDGPVAVGRPFPDFRASLPDGKPFTRADLEGDRATALVFFRGRW